MTQNKSKGSSVEKTLDILLAFAPYNQEMGPTEIARKLGYHKATVSRILLTLSRYGFLHQNPKTRKYILGGAIIRLGNACNKFLKSNIVQIAKPYADELREKLKETVVIEVFSGENSYMAYVSEGPQRIRVAAEIGEMLPKHAAAGAKAILAFSPLELKKIILNDPMPRLTPNTITNPKKYLRHLQQIQKEGVAFDIEEIDLGISAVGAPIFNHEGNPVAAIVVVGPSQRIAGDKNSPLVSRLKITAAKISAQLHYVK